MGSYTFNLWMATSCQGRSWSKQPQNCRRGSIQVVKAADIQLSLHSMTDYIHVATLIDDYQLLMPQ